MNKLKRKALVKRACRALVKSAEWPWERGPFPWDYEPLPGERETLYNTLRYAKDHYDSDVNALQNDLDKYNDLAYDARRSYYGMRKSYKGYGPRLPYHYNLRAKYIDDLNPIGQAVYTGNPYYSDSSHKGLMMNPNDIVEQIKTYYPDFYRFTLPPADGPKSSSPIPAINRHQRSLRMQQKKPTPIE